MQSTEILNKAQPDEVIIPTWSTPPEVNMHALIDYRRGQVRRRQYRPLGILEKVMLEASGIADISGANPLVRNSRLSANFDFYKTGPLVGTSDDGKDLLICGPMPHPPTIPDPEWIQPFPPKEFLNGLPVPATPPRIPQRLRDRASGQFAAVPARNRWPGWLWTNLPAWSRHSAHAETDDFWFVFQPVHQLLLLLVDRGGMAMVDCSADSTGRHTTMLYNPAHQEGHILFGAKRVELYRG